MTRWSKSASTEQHSTCTPWEWLRQGKWHHLPGKTGNAKSLDWLWFVALFSSKFWQRLTSAGVGRSFWRIPKKACVLGSIVWAEGSTNSFEKSLNMSELWNRMKTKVKWMVALQHRTAIFGQWSDVLHLRIIKPTWSDVQVKIQKNKSGLILYFPRLGTIHKYTQMTSMMKRWIIEDLSHEQEGREGREGLRGSAMGTSTARHFRWIRRQLLELFGP